jgi:Na+-transporting methylmalonyl-CoA/oxaloacetate decarboxylase gamma subunit
VEPESTFTEADEFVLGIAEKRVALEEDSNKTFQQKAALLMAAVGLFLTFVGQMLMKATEAWRASPDTAHSVAIVLLALNILVLLVAAICLLSAIFATYSAPASPSEWRDHLRQSRERLREQQSPNAEGVAFDHLRQGYLAALIESADMGAAANARKSRFIEAGTHMLTFATALIIFAFVTFLIQAMSVPSQAPRSTKTRSVHG